MNILITNEAVKDVFHIAQSIARENYNATFGAPHILQALLHKDIGLRDFLVSLDKDPNYFYEWAEVRIEEYPKTSSLPNVPTQDEKVNKIIQEADDVRIKLGLEDIAPICILVAIVKVNIAFTAQELKSLPIREHEIFHFFSEKDKQILQQENSLLSDFSYNRSNFPAIENYCTDKTLQAKNGKVDEIVGRDMEIRLLIEILSRRTKPNVILVGEPGVGKTALLEGFAREITQENVPELLKEATILELDLASLIAGTSYKGEVEDRLKKVINECKKIHKTILFIDEIHSLLDTRSSTGNIANLLKPELARGEITIIGATTQEEYRKIIEPERAFNRRFEVLTIQEPDETTCVKMLAKILPAYTEHHKVEVDITALPDCVKLAKRYSKGKKLPDAAIDLLDRTMASIKMMEEMSEKDVNAWYDNYKKIIDETHETDPLLIEELIWNYNLLKNKLSPIVWGSLPEQYVLETSMGVTEIKNIILHTFDELIKITKVKREKIGKLELAAVMASKTGIPIGKIQAGEKEKLLNMEELLQKRVVGQNQALKILADAIIESRSGLAKPGQPIGSFFLLGPTGTGKTELAKSMAELLFNDEKSMIRFDMSEFKEEHSAALLYGAPPGYVGYEEGGMLVNKIREQPYAVVLFDEIEKAHPSVFDVFLQIMDEGKIHDKLGKEGDFSNSLILFTSNIGSEQITKSFEKGEIPTSKDLLKIMNDSGSFRPEFLARITEIIPFSPITEVMAENIFHIQLKNLKNSLNRLGIGLEISDEAVRNLALNGFNSKYGARQISGVIRSQLARPISKKIVNEDVKSGQTIHIGWKNESIDWKFLNK